MLKAIEENVIRERVEEYIFEMFQVLDVATFGRVLLNVDSNCSSSDFLLLLYFLVVGVCTAFRNDNFDAQEAGIESGKACWQGKCSP
jgi:hypothetical protein